MLLRTLAFLPAPQAKRIERLLAAAPVRFLPARSRANAALADGGVELLLVAHKLWRGRIATDVAQQRVEGVAPEVIVLVDSEEPQLRAQLLGSGVLAVLNLTLADQLLAEALSSVVQRARSSAVQRLRVLHGAPPASLGDFVSHSDEMQRLLLVARRMAASDATLLLMGETGVGKERLARAIHDEGTRREGPFVAVNCGALPEALLESELFGHEQGAFTGAVRSHRGLFELAHGGTLFLDEVGEMPMPLQVALLRVLQDRRIRPVGSERDIEVDVRIVAASNRNLHAEQLAGRFRADLYYRLAVVCLTIPPLRERRADIPALVQNHLEALCLRLNRRAITVSDAALERLCKHDWPGNVRELANVLERAVLLGDGQALAVADLSGIGDSQVTPASWDRAADLWQRPFATAAASIADDFARAYFTALLRAHHGRVGVVAKHAGLSARTLYTHLQRLGLQKEVYRRAPGRRLN
jgi:two-component system, NtrC family, response regulator AtoC